ncbi:MAG: peptide ABC transporter permease [Deltaproteobacteria bacterium]|nr:peptide ABC transporter permease [Deltaproteobacteria bacterium]
MLNYVLRRIGYGIFVVLGVLLLLFILFFAVTTPEDVARKALGERVPVAVIEQWKVNHGYDKPLLPGPGAWRDNMLVEHYRRMLTFDFGRSDADDVPISERIKSGIGPSLALTLPLFILSLVVALPLSLLVAFFRETYIDRTGVVLAVLAMSVSILLYIIGAQYIIGRVLHWFPISGFDADPRVILRFLALPILVGLCAGIGGDLRFYRTVFLEESNTDYVRTARAKGCGEARIMSRHVFRNSLIPLLTRVVLAIPFLFMGSLLLESFFGIPGLGAITVDAIQGNDFSVLRTMVYIGSLLFVGGQILTDLSYGLVDPRVRLE